MVSAGLCSLLCYMMISEGAPQTGGPGGAENSSQTGLPKRILVVEDEPSIRQLLTNSLTRAGYRVDAAENGALAWEALQVRRYDLLITDNNMPKITGIDLVKKLRKKNTVLPVVMATGTFPKAELERHPRLGISDILIKPFAFVELLRTVKKVLCEAEGVSQRVS
jgi:DNA-binding response OmpR family regulator